MSKRLLQITNGLLALLTIALSVTSLWYGQDNPIYQFDHPINQALDSNLRFMGGMGLGLGCSLLWITPSIEKHGFLFRVVWITAFLGGIGRLISMTYVGLPPIPITVFTLIEVPGVPLLIYWQLQVAKQFAPG